MHLFVDNLTNVDFSYLDPSRGLVGETWLASIVLEGALDEQGMVCDFGIVKKTVRNWLDTYIDHCLVVATQAPSLTLQQQQDTINLTWSYSGDQLQCSSPAQAISLIDSETISPDSVSTWCITELKKILPDTIDRILLTFTPEVIEHHSYHYSHGLKKHLGNCQRIAHGHRSTIQIFKNDQRDHALEAQWCARWEDIYIGTRSDLVSHTESDQSSHYHFAYDSEQGHFELTIPISNCYLIDTDTTVEFIAQHIANTLKQQDPNNTFTVKAYEGIGKGAIAFS
jgi:6-pyruvoyl-tetrahydropterin synthase